MKHTKTPWMARGKGGTSDGGSTKQHPCFVGDIVAANGQAIVKFSSFIGVQGKTPAEAEANAWLIAAAPELLEALKAIAQIGGNLPDERLTDKTGPDDAAHRGLMYCHARELARAAIEKAESAAAGRPRG